jgi:4-amino-4-deoxy-L-arabinose transferase-like glycosyltransferase
MQAAGRATRERPDASPDGAPRPFAIRTLLIPAGLAAIVFLAHLAYIRLPYFWDELGQFVPAALDILRDGAWIPHSTVPNSHPPEVMAYLALVWRIAGYSIVATRLSMLALASAGVIVTLLLGRDLSGRPAAILGVLFLLLDPLFYTQAMLAQLDMPAMLFSVLALLLFLKDRHALAAGACTALVLAKETGAILPLIFIAVLCSDSERRRYALYYVAPFAALAVWFFALWRTTGYLFGDPGYTHYNIAYALNPVRASVTILRRLYYLFVNDFRWVGTLAMVAAVRRRRLYATRGWRIAGCFIAAHVLLVSLLGGAALERYLLPVLPLVYIAMGAAFESLRTRWRYLGIAALAGGLLAGLFVNPPFPFPYENNLALVDFVELDRAAAQFVERAYPAKTIYTAWPLTQALRDPVFGYVARPMKVEETSDLRVSTLDALHAPSVGVLILYSRTWEPGWGVLQWPAVREFLSRYYEYERQMTPAEVERRFGLSPMRRWSRRGQWIEVFAR